MVILALPCCCCLWVRGSNSKLMVLHGVGHVFWNESLECQLVVRAFFAAQDYLVVAAATLTALKAKL